MPAGIIDLFFLHETHLPGEILLGLAHPVLLPWGKIASVVCAIILLLSGPREGNELFGIVGGSLWDLPHVCDSMEGESIDS